MRRDDLIRLLLEKVPNGDDQVYVENLNIHDGTLDIRKCEGRKSQGYFQFTPSSGTYYLLHGLVGP